MAGGLYDSAVYDSATYYGEMGDPFVELLINGVWTDITGYVRVDPPISITRGKQDWAGSPNAAQCRLTLDNRDGRFSPRNASGAYYGFIGRNTQIRVSVYLDDGSSTVRFWGDVAEWPVTWETTGREVTTSIVANGLRRSLQKLTEEAPFRAAMLAAGGAQLIGYWPMEDGTRATSFGSALSGGAPGVFTGTANAITLGSDSTTFLAANPLPEFGDGAAARFTFPPYSPASGGSDAGQQLRMLLKCTGTGGFLVRVDTVGAHYFLFEYSPAADQFRWDMFNYTTGATEYSSFTYSVPTYFPTPHTGVRFGLWFKQDGTGIDVQFWMMQPGATGAVTNTETVPSATLGYLTGCTLYMDPAGGSTATVGHLTMESHATSIYDLLAVLGDYAGDSAADRAARLTTEKNVPYLLKAGPVTSALMGPQPVGTFLDVFDECATVEDGISTEDVTTRSLLLRKRSSMYSQTPVLSFTYTTSGGVQQMVPVDDDQFLVNDVTVTRTGGASARVTDTTSAVSTTAVGTYAVEYVLNLYTDDQCADQAAWRLGEGTVNKPRLSSLMFDAYTQSTSAMRTAAVAMREGDVVQIASVPAFTGLGSTVQQRILGWTEEIGYRTWMFTLNCIDAGGYQQVLILDDATYGILDTDRLGL